MSRSAKTEFENGCESRRMNIAIINTLVPFVRGGAESLAETLCQKISEKGYKATIIQIPFSWRPSQKIIESILSTRLLQLPRVDKIIALKFPAYFLQHPNKTVWLCHQFRQAYDFWGTSFQDIPNSLEGKGIRQIIINSDNTFLKEATNIYAISNIVSERLKTYNNLDSEVLYPPLAKPDAWFCQNYENYLFFPSRIARSKRQWLAVEAMNYTKSPIKLIIAGAPDRPEDSYLIKEKIETLGLENKITFISEKISERKKINLMSNALACLFIPYDEDYGYVTLEAFQAKKSVITCQDSGGTTSFVKDGETGFILPPSPEALAQKFDELYIQKSSAKKLGEQGFELLKQMNINWDHVLRKLLQ